MSARTWIAAEVVQLSGRELQAGCSVYSAALRTMLLSCLAYVHHLVLHKVCSIEAAFASLLGHPAVSLPSVST